MGMSRDGVLALLRGIIKAVEDGNVAVHQLEGLTLAEMSKKSEEGWDHFDEVVQEGLEAGHGGN